MDDTAEFRRRVALAIFNDKGIEFGAFRLKSHKRWPEAPLSPIFVNLRLAGSSQTHEGKLTAGTVDLIGRLMVARYGELITKLPDSIIGIPDAGEPIVDAILKHLPEAARVKRLRLAKIGTGDRRVIVLKEGETYPPRTKVLLVDDLITRADTKIEAAAALQRAGLAADTCLVIVDREQGGPEEAKVAGFTVVSLFTISSLLSLYKINGLISAEQVKEVQTYQAKYEEYVRTHPPVSG